MEVGVKGNSEALIIVAQEQATDLPKQGFTTLGKTLDAKDAKIPQKYSNIYWQDASKNNILKDITK